MQKINKNIKQTLDFLKQFNTNNQGIEKILSWHSQSIRKGQVFVSIKTKLPKRYDYIDEAISRGAKAVISDVQIKKSSLSKNLPTLYSEYLKDNHNKFLNFIYKNPLKNIKVFGVTGTDGKTSQVHLLAQSLHLCGKKVGVISSEGNGIYPKLDKTHYTTPRVDILFNYFNKFNLLKTDIVIIECSSQGIDQGRIRDIEFSLSILTNINKDHIEYHHSFRNYINAKIKLLNMTKKHIFLNKNCPTTTNNIKLITTKAKKHFFNVGDIEDLGYLRNLTNSDNINIEVVSKVLRLQSIPLRKIRETIFQLKPIVGRNQFIRTKNKGAYIVDYAHTPSSLLILLENVGYSLGCVPGNIITVFGCGGDRDIWKRKAMGSVASKFSSHIILTDDNPRTEQPMKIINDIKKGISKTTNLSIIPSRKNAIRKAIYLATKGDYIVIAGKGNENDIQYKNRIVKHNDLKVLKALLK